MTAESMLWLLMTGRVPTPEQSQQLSAELAEMGRLPSFVEELIDSCVVMPPFHAQWMLIIRQLATDTSSHDPVQYECRGVEP